jgi:hypothetical protein
MQQPYGSEGSDGVASPDDRDETAESELLASTNGKQKQNHNFTNWLFRFKNLKEKEIRFLNI